MAHDVARLHFAPHSYAAENVTELSITSDADMTSAARMIANAVRKHGLRLMGWHNIATMEPLQDVHGNPLNESIFGWSEEALAPWYKLDVALRFPIVKACRIASEPFWMNSLGAWPSGQNRFMDRVDMTGFENCIPARAAIIMPIRIPFGQIAAAILVSVDEAKDDLSEEFAEFTGKLAVPIHRFMRACAMINLDDRYLPTDTQLTRREIECLSWVAHGKTDHEISIILGCSHAGVRYHLTRVAMKLDATNRAQSVFKACQLGYIGAPLGTQRPQVRRSGSNAQIALAL